MTFQVHRFEGGDRNMLGYARVSKMDQNLAAQLDALQKAGAHMVISEKVSSVAPRLGWQRVCDLARPGDVVAVVRLDRIGRRLAEIIASVQGLADEKIHVRALQQGLDTSSPGGSIMLALWAALAETERTTLRERTREGLAAAKARGKKAGRPTVIDPQKQDLAAHLKAQGYTTRQIGKTLRVGATTVRRMLADLQKQDPKQLKLLPAEAPAPSSAASSSSSSSSSSSRAPSSKKPTKRKRAASRPRPTPTFTPPIVTEHASAKRGRK